MRKILTAVTGALCLFAGTAMANDFDRGNQVHYSSTAPGASTRQLKLHRWGYNLGGKDLDANRVCNGAPVTEVHEYRTGKDIALSIFSLGWYTPKTARVTCGG